MPSLWGMLVQRDDTSRVTRKVFSGSCPTFTLKFTFFSFKFSRVIAFEVPRMQTKISVGCSVHYWVSCAINRGGFLEIAFASLWGACLRFASRGDLCILGVHLSNVCWGLLFFRTERSSLKACWIFVKRTCVRFCWRSTIDLCLMNPQKPSSFESLLKVYTLNKILLWINPVVHIFLCKMGATPGACIKPRCLARRPFCHKVNLPSGEARQRHFIRTCEIVSALDKRTI